MSRWELPHCIPRLPLGVGSRGEGYRPEKPGYGVWDTWAVEPQDFLEALGRHLPKPCPPGGYRGNFRPGKRGLEPLMSPWGAQGPLG